MTSLSVLIVDDDQALLEALPEAMRLRMGGVTVETADSAAAALDRIAERDYDAICALLSSSLRDQEKSYHYNLDLKEILVSGDLAAVRLVWTLTVARKEGGVIETIQEPGIDIFRRQRDGLWKIARYLAFPIAPRP